MSTTANTGLNQADYNTMNRTEPSPSAAGVSTGEAISTQSQPSPQSEAISSNERLTAAVPGQDNVTSLSKGEKGQKTVEESEKLVNHKSGSVETESGQTGLTTSHGHVTSGEAATMKGVSVRGDGTMSSSTKGIPSGGGGGGGGELQLPAKQALAVLSNVSKIYHFFPMILCCC